jgi:4-amino-4-deoxy-L-arabinose transferase-like glycosyltransferase
MIDDATPRVAADDQPSRAVVVGVLLALLVAGFWLRARNLDALGLIVDEGTQALAVRGALEHGLPLLDSGEVYTRNPLFLFVQVISANVLGLGEFGLRLPSVLFGTAGILAAYLLGAATLGRRVGLLTAALIAFSAWEIELSRYARFYTMFQFMYALSLFCFYRGFMRGERRYRVGFGVAALVTLATHELSVMLGFCFLIPLFSPAFSRAKKVGFVALAALYGGIWVVYRKSMFLLNERPTFGDPGPVAVAAETPPTLLERIGVMIPVPGIHLPDPSGVADLARARPWLLLLPAALAAGASVILLRHPERERRAWRTLLPLATIWAACFHQFGLALVIAAIHIVVVSRRPRALFEPALRVVPLVSFLLLAFWAAVLITNASSTPRATVMTLFGYPNFLQYFLYWYVRGWPVLTVIFAVGLLILLRRHLADRTAPAPLFLLGALIIPVVLTSFFRAFQEARYTFHLYPLMLVVFAGTCLSGGLRLRRLVAGEHSRARAVAAATFALAVLFVSQDANPVKAWSIGSRGYETAKDPIRSVINWQFYAGFHQDHKTPSLWVRERLRPGDRVFAAGPPHMISDYHYYGRVDSMIGRWSDYLYYRKLADGRTVGYITGSDVLQDVDRLQHALGGEGGHAIWLLADRMLLAEGNDFYPRPLKTYLEELAREPDYEGLDGQTFAVRIR